MISLDTNILARLLLGDDIAQLARAKALLSRAQQFTAPITVMLELVWVLEANGVEPTALADGLERLVSLPNFEPAHLAGIHQSHFMPLWHTVYQYQPAGQHAARIQSGIIGDDGDVVIRMHADGKACRRIQRRVK